MGFDRRIVANKSAFEPSKSALSGCKITASSAMFRSNVMVESGMIRGRTFSSSRVLYKVRVHFEIGLDDKVHDKSTLKKYKVQYKSTYKIIYSTISFIPSIY